jgi:hypothetical protein
LFRKKKKPPPSAKEPLTQLPVSDRTRSDSPTPCFFFALALTLVVSSFPRPNMMAKTRKRITRGKIAPIVSPTFCGSSHFFLRCLTSHCSRKHPSPSPTSMSGKVRGRNSDEALLLFLETTRAARGK